MRQAMSCAQVSFAFLISQNTMFKWLIKKPPFSAAPICFSSSLIMWRRGCQFYSTLLNNSPAFLMLRHTNSDVNSGIIIQFNSTFFYLSIIISMPRQVCARKVLIWKCLSPQYHIVFNQSTGLKCSSHSCSHNISFSVTVINGDKK